MFFLAVVMSLMAALISTFSVTADDDSHEGHHKHSKHDPGCASYCKRAVLYEDFDGDGVWMPWDADLDGKVEKCAREFNPAIEQTCTKMNDVPGYCPEIDSSNPAGGTNYDRCALPQDGTGYWCRLMHGKDTHHLNNASGDDDDD